MYLSTPVLLATGIALLLAFSCLAWWARRSGRERALIPPATAPAPAPEIDDRAAGLLPSVDGLCQEAALLKATNQGIAALLAARDWRQPLAQILAGLAEAAGACQAYVFANRPVSAGDPAPGSPAPGYSGFTRLAAWAAPGLELAAESGAGPGTQPDGRLEQFLALWAEGLSQGYPIQGQLSGPPGSEQAGLNLVAAPLMIHQAWWGTLFLAGCQPGRQWTAAELNALTSTARGLAAAMARQEAEEQERQAKSEQAANQERERLGRELRAELGPLLDQVGSQAQAAGDWLLSGQPEQAQLAIEQLAGEARAASDTLRQWSLGLSAPQPTPGPDWVAALRDYLHTFSRTTGIAVQLNAPLALPPEQFPPGAGAHLLRVIQEALTNVHQHAGVQAAQVLLLLRDDHLEVVITDNGRGFTPSLPGAANDEAPTDHDNGYRGLARMRLLAEKAGGSLEVLAAPGAGVQVVARVPRFEKARRVLLVDDHLLFLDGMQNLLTAHGFEVVGLGHDGLEAQELARQLRPDLILMDIHMPRCDGLEATRRIKAELPEVTVVILTVAAEESVLFEALKLGAAGYLLKGLDSKTFFHLLREVMRGQIVLSQGLATRALTELAPRNALTNDGELASGAPAGLPTRAGAEATQQPAGPPNLLASLSERQRLILEMLAQGMTYKEAAAALHVSPVTIKYHMGQIVNLLQVNTRRQAITLARQAGLGLRR